MLPILTSPAVVILAVTAFQILAMINPLKLLSPLRCCFYSTANHCLTLLGCVCMEILKKMNVTCNARQWWLSMNGNEMAFLWFETCLGKKFMKEIVNLLPSWNHSAKYHNQITNLGFYTFTCVIWLSRRVAQWKWCESNKRLVLFLEISKFNIYTQIYIYIYIHTYRDRQDSQLTSWMWGHIYNTVDWEFR